MAQDVVCRPRCSMGTWKGHAPSCCVDCSVNVDQTSPVGGALKFSRTLAGSWLVVTPAAGNAEPPTGPPSPRSPHSTSVLLTHPATPPLGGCESGWLRLPHRFYFDMFLCVSGSFICSEVSYPVTMVTPAF